MDPRIKTILEYAVMAPSGDNCQPWKVCVDGLKVDLFNVPDRDRSLYNLKQRASLIAHGAFLENLQLAARSIGLKGHIELLPDPGNAKHVATVTFSTANAETSELYKAIPLRCTNRERYLPVKISDKQIKQWQDLTTGDGEKIWASCDQGQMRSLARLLSLNDRLVFEVPALHQFLFEQIRWNDEEARTTGDGLDIKTLGLNPIDRIFFRLFKSWALIATINRIGFSKIIQFKAKQLVNSSSAIAIITMQGADSKNYIKGGATWQRLLLQLASEGLHAQPIAGLACLMQSAKEDLLENNVTARQHGCLLHARSDLLRITGANDSDVILAIFRVGQGPHVIRSLRRPFDALMIE